MKDLIKQVDSQSKHHEDIIVNNVKEHIESIRDGIIWAIESEHSQIVNKIESYITEFEEDNMPICRDEQLYIEGMEKILSLLKESML